MTVLMHISDTHFGTERAPVQSALQQLTHEVQPDVLVLSGDITQRGTRAQFSAARSFIDSLNVTTVLAIPGNHDIPLFNIAARLFRPYARYSEAFGTILEPEFENDELLVLALNTTRRYRHIDGALSTAQIERVAARLEQSPRACWRIVVTHQPLAVPSATDANNLLHGHRQALQRWAAAGANVVMGGHIHLPYVMPLHGGMTAVSDGLWAIQAGTALSHRVRADAPNSVNVLRIESGAAAESPLKVERWNYQASAQRFTCVKVDLLQRRRLWT
jgi:3',5'-cyclic AMP phosphodiesterase CpdA